MECTPNHTQHKESKLPFEVKGSDVACAELKSDCFKRLSIVEVFECISTLRWMVFALNSSPIVSNGCRLSRFSSASPPSVLILPFEISSLALLKGSDVVCVGLKSDCFKRLSIVEVFECISTLRTDISSRAKSTCIGRCSCSC